MNCIQNHRSSIACVLPGHILKSISQSGTSEQRARSIQTLSIDNTVRALRAVLAGQGRSQTVGQKTAEGQKYRTIYTTNHTQNLPGQVVRTEGSSASTDVAVNEAYDGLGATYDFFSDEYGRNSIDDEGMPLNASVHFGQGYDNAFWNGQQMVFGDGDGDLFNRFTISLDVIGHELAHGVTEDEARLVYFYQPGALNESMSDVMGSLVKQRLAGQTADKADWLIGVGLFTNNVNGKALRSMKAPGTAYNDPVIGKDPQPAHMKDYVSTFEDNGGVHINSGIPNHAFYLVATRIGGHAWERSGRIWYETLRDPRLRPNSGFRRFAKLTYTNATRLFGDKSNEQKAVKDSWGDVGVGVC